MSTCWAQHVAFVCTQVYCGVTLSLTFPSLLLKAHANGRNIVGQKPPTTRNNVVSCCVRLHGPLSSLFLFLLLGVFSRWQRTIAIALHFRVFHRLYSSSAIIADQRDSIAVSQRILGKYQTQTPLHINVKATLSNICDRLNTLKPTSANTIPTMLGDVAPTCCVRLHGASVITERTARPGSAV